MLGYFAETPLSANLLRLVSAIQKHAGYRGAAPVGDAGGFAPRKKNLKKNVVTFKKTIVSEQK